MKRFRLTARLRLTILFGVLFFVAGMALLLVNYTLVEQSIGRPADNRRAELLEDAGIEVPDERSPGGRRQLPDSEQVTIGGKSFADVVVEIEEEIRRDTLEQLLAQSILALATTGVIAIGLGWFVAGRVLRPVHQIAQTARAASESNLHARVNLSGPSDELKELADTFDRMLDRLEAAFESQRRFAGQVSHELRTPISILRTEADITFGESSGTARERDLATIMSATASRTEQIIDSLLMLARSESQLRNVESVDLSQIVGDVLGEQAQHADRRDIEIEIDLMDACLQGDRVLLERLVTNLIANGIVHNQPDNDGRAWLRIQVGTTDGTATLTVANSGPMLSNEDIDLFFEPFHGSNDRDPQGHARGAGLGLTIAGAITSSHGGSISARPLSPGGLEILVRLPNGISDSQ